MNIKYSLISGNYEFPEKKKEKIKEEVQREDTQQEDGFYVPPQSYIYPQDYTTSSTFTSNSSTDASLSFGNGAAPSINFDGSSSDLELTTSNTFLKRLKNLSLLPFVYLFKGKVKL